MGATPYVSVSVSVSVFRTRVRHFKIHLATILCPFFDGFGIIWRGYTLHYRVIKNDVIVTFLPSMSVVERV